MAIIIIAVLKLPHLNLKLALKTIAAYGNESLF